MDSYEITDDFDHLDTQEVFYNIRNMPQEEQPFNAAQQSHRPRRTKSDDTQLLAALLEQGDWQESFEFSYQASHYEHDWIIDSIGPFHEGKWIDDVVRLVKGGKEAHVYQCLANPSVSSSHDGDLHNNYIAAKVYRPRMFRNLRKDHVYRQGRNLLDEDGRLVKDEGTLHAVHKRTGYGKRALHISWIEHEFQTMRVLHDAGADVPVPFERGHNAILMSFIGGDFQPAPTLNQVHLKPDEALTLYHRTIKNIDLMLANNRVHGDLSAYNILYWEGEITLIDFPQTLDPHVNHNAFSIFSRDVRRVCEYFASHGIKNYPQQIAEELWTAHGHRLTSDVHPGLLDADNEGDRAYWRQINNR